MYYTHAYTFRYICMWIWIHVCTYTPAFAIAFIIYAMFSIARNMTCPCGHMFNVFHNFWVVQIVSVPFVVKYHFLLNNSTLIFSSSGNQASLWNSEENFYFLSTLINIGNMFVQSGVCVPIPCFPLLLGEEKKSCLGGQRFLTSSCTCMWNRGA